MCGISVICGLGDGQPLLQTLRAMHDRASHRGPDGEGWLAVDANWRPILSADGNALRTLVGDRRLRLGAAFRWLRIQDRNPLVCQPMGSASGDIWVLFNGEIYNHREIRDELRARGRAFRTNSDTEALLAAYEHWGPDGFARLTGMWGAVVIDLKQRAVTVSRDRFGIRPLFYRHCRDQLLFGSEAKQLISLHGERPEAERNALAGFLVGRRPDADTTYFAGVKPVPSATWSTVSLDAAVPDRMSFQPYWTLSDQPVPAHRKPESLAGAADRLEHLLRDSVGHQSIAEVPVGALLSGGLDSSVLTTLLVDAMRQRGLNCTLVSVTSDDATGDLDERPFMRAMADAVAGDDVTSVESAIEPSWVAASIDKVSWHQEEPIQGIAVVAHYRAHEAAASLGLRVVLEGTGADELFGGYPRHQLARIQEYARRRRWLDATSELTGSALRSRVFGPWFLETVGAVARRRLGRLGGGGPGWLAGPAPSARPATKLRGRPEDRESLLAQMSRADLTRGNIPAVLAITDRNAMAHSVETRVPYLDHRVVEFAFHLPDQLKVARGSTKIVLRRIADGRLPALVAQRRARIGFGMPVRRWLRGALRTTVLSTLDEMESGAGQLLRPAEARKFVKDFLDARHDDLPSVWRIFALARWLRQYPVSLD